jgi:autotransporter passenger strand-loop-strand repeat protein
VGYFAFYETEDGVASGTVVSKGGSQFVSGGNVFATTISAGGVQLIAGGGGVGTVLDGGSATVQLSATVTGTVINSGGQQFVVASATASGTMVNAGGQELVGLSATDSATTVNASGLETVASGGVAYGVTIAGGTLDVASGGTVSGGVSFAAGAGTLEIDSTVLPTAVISGFAAGDAIDLTALTYDPNATVTVATSGIVTISADGAQYSLNIAGVPAGDTSFSLSADTGTGTILRTSDTMAFIRPTSGGSESAALPAMSDVVTNASSGTMVVPGYASTATQPAAWSAALVQTASGGVERALLSHTVT